MAAPMVGKKISKSERKLQKKRSRSIHMLMRHEGIEICDAPTKNLFVANAGLGNGVTRDEVANLFTPYGILDDVIMVTEKPYAFVCFSEKESAVKAHEMMNGKLLKCPEEVATHGLKFYTAYIENVPGMKPVSSDTLPPGLILLPDFISEECERTLIECIKWDDADPEKGAGERDQRSLKHRRVKHFGYEFIYGINNVDPEKPLPQGIPSECDDVIDRILQLSYVKKRPDQLTVNQYEPGQGIPPHVDTHSAFEDGIISLSTGAQVVMDFRHPSGTHIPVVLPPRSLLIMTGESRYVWTHGITPRKSDVVETKSLGAGLTLAHRGTRTSFTFRVLRRRPCDCAFPEQCDSQKQIADEETGTLPKSSSDAATLENKHVHEVYEEIASHFSDTRHSPWPKVAEFLKGLPMGSLVVDVGCGNGKYLGVNSELFMIGNDRSVNLSAVCQERGFHVFVCDCLSIPLRPESFDACICIAVIHHLTTKERRLAAIKEITSKLRVGGKALIYVWAFEQELNKVKSNYLKQSKTDGNVDKGRDQSTSLCCARTVQNSGNCDIALDSSKCKAVETSDENSELDQVSTGCSPSFPVHVNRTQFKSQDMLVPWHKKEKASGSGEGGQTDKVYHRFYHVFKKGELEELCKELPNVRIEHTYYDKGNWCVVIERTC